MVFQIAHPGKNTAKQTNVGLLVTFPATIDVTAMRLLYENTKLRSGGPLALSRADGWTTVVRRGSGDRRDCVRFEVFGFFWGSFDVGETVRVRNLTSSGALIEAGEPLAVESIQSICVSIDGQPTVAEARVRHLTPITSASCSRYLVGVEFLAVSSAFQEAVDRLIAFRSSPTEPA